MINKSRRVGGWVNEWMKGCAWPCANAEDITVSKAHIISYSHLVTPRFSVLQKGIILILSYLRILYSYETSIHVNMHNPLWEPCPELSSNRVLSHYPLDATMDPSFD